jgi:ATP-dependent DNA helicase RecG
MKEQQHIEWKESWRDEYLRWISGFANAEGGVLVIGRNDNGEVVGVPDAKRLLVDLPNKVRDLLGVVVDVNLRTDAGQDYLEVAVAAYPNPISYRGEYFYRSGSTNQTLKGAALDRFLLRKQGRHWDGVPAPGFEVADLSAQAFVGFRRLAAKSKRLSPELLEETDEVLLDKLRLLENPYLKRAAVLLFHEEPERLVTGAYVKIGYFRTDSDLLYQDEVHGGLLDQVTKTVDLLLTKYLRAGISYEGLQRLETFPIPEEALREAVINAIAHKDYGSAIPIQISVYHDKLMIWNPGELPPNWTIELLTAKHSSSPYNPDIANVFFRVAFLESWGRGIDLIRNACRVHGSPEPRFDWDNGLWVVFPFGLGTQSEPLDEAAATRPASESGLESGLESRLESGLKSRLESRLAGRVLLLLRNAEMGKAGLANALGHATVSGGLHRQIRRLTAAGYIVMTVPEKPSSRLQKYRLTQQGLSLIEAVRQEAGPE